MQSKKFSVYEAVVYGFKSVVDTMRLFFPLFLTLVAVFIGLLAITALINMSLAREIVGAMPQLEECKGEVCSVVVNTVIWPLAQKHMLSLGLTFILMFLVGIGLFLGYKRIMLDFYDTGRSSVKRLFSCFYLVPKAFLAALLYLIAVGFGLMLFLVPGIYLMLRLRFFSYFIVDKNSGIIESLQQSWAITRHQEWDILSLMLVWITFVSVSLAGGMIGVLVIPIMELAYVLAYRKLAS